MDQNGHIDLGAGLVNRVHQNLREGGLSNIEVVNAFESDVVSYDASLLFNWPVPESLLESLSPTVQEATTNWQRAGAAVDSALARIKELDSDSIYRGWPEHTRTQLLLNGLDNSRAEDACNGDRAAPPGSTAHPTASTNRPSLIVKLFLGRQRDQAGTMPRPANGHERTAPASAAAVPLHPPTTQPDAPPAMSAHAARRDSATPVHHNGPARPAPAFHEISWNTFLQQHRAEVRSLRAGAQPRLRACTARIHELTADAREWSEDAAGREARAAFVAWWAGAQGAVAQREQLVDMLAEPRRELVEVQRAAKGLPV